jgi:hypothetical protein
MLICQWIIAIWVFLGTLACLAEASNESGSHMLGAIIGRAIVVSLLYFAGTFSLILP